MNMAELLNWNDDIVSVAETVAQPEPPEVYTVTKTEPAPAPAPKSRKPDLRTQLTALLAEHGALQNSGTPDHILAEYLLDAMSAFDRATRRRDDYRKSESER